ncbi:F-box/kelch-repeat protein At1g57790-like [Bidens hawaiensis]|uniref:F-box/kelch-repeat protein At1g57790-like n=1 Tax=Bidens hawaiensis TaxID=980011 RepID=UPI00404A2F94
MDMTSKLWKEMVDLEDAVFFLQLSDGRLACYYNYVVESELAGYIHVLGECGKVIYSFHVKDRAATISSLPCLVQESQVSAWAMLEWRLEVDRAEEKKKEDRDTEIVVRPVNGEFHSTTSESHLLNMPLHILESIMELCVGVEYMKFRATCKRCSLAAPLIQWSTKTKLKSCSLISLWLMVLDNYQDTITFIDPMFGDMYFMKTPQELKGGYEIHCSRYGWLLMYKFEKGSRLVFFNPFTVDIRELPEVKYMESFCFSAPPTSPNCMVVGFTRAGAWHVCIYFVSRESAWSVYSLEFGSDPYYFHFPIFRGQDIYTLCNDERIEVFRDLTDDDYSWEDIGDVPSRSSAQYFLSNCDQHLLLVIIGKFGRSVEVFKLDESTQEWEKVDALGKHMIFICNTSCLCLEAKSPEMGNKIYFPRLLHKDNTKIVFYSFETCRYHTFDDKHIQESFGANFFETKHLCFPHAWIEPSWP